MTKTDIGVDDLEKAKQNRERIASKERVEAYEAIQKAIEYTPQTKTPRYYKVFEDGVVVVRRITLGDLPYVSRSDLKKLGGDDELIIEKGD